MESKLFDRISVLFKTPFPEANNLDGYLDKILPLIASESKKLEPREFYSSKDWVEVRESEDFHELVFHFFSPKPVQEVNGEELEWEYLKSIDGEAWQGRWRYVNNKIFIGDEEYTDTKVYELAFLDNEFMILRLLANPKKFTTENKSKYFLMTVEKLGRRLEWLDLVKYLFDKYHSLNINLYIIVILTALIIAVLLS